MAERKHKRETESEVDIDESGFILEPTQVEVGSGYTLSINYDENENPIINIKTYGHVDMPKIRKEIEKLFPNAKITQQDQSCAITVSKKHKRKNKK